MGPQAARIRHVVMWCPVTRAQMLYPLIAATEAIILLSARWRPSRAQNAAALTLWLAVQFALFCVLEPASFLAPTPLYCRIYYVVSVLSAVADLVVLYSIFDGLENGFRAFGSVRAWSCFAILTGLVFCLAAGLPLPLKARGFVTVCMMMDQVFGYVRISALIALALFGWLRASSWPSDLAWTWLAMAAYSIAESVVVRVEIVASNYQLLESVTSAAALLQLAGWWRALSYAPKPLTENELEAIAVLTSSTCKGSDTQ